MRSGRELEYCASASRSPPTRSAARRAMTRSARAAMASGMDRLALPLLAARRDRERDAAEEDQGREGHEGALVAPEDHEEARHERAQGVAQALEETVDAVHRVVAVDADLLVAVLGHERALRRDR